MIKPTWIHSSELWFPLCCWRTWRLRACSSLLRLLSSSKALCSFRGLFCCGSSLTSSTTVMPFISIAKETQRVTMTALPIYVHLLKNFRITCQVWHITFCCRILDDCIVLHMPGLWREPHQSAQNMKNKHADPVRKWRAVSGAVQQVGNEDGLQETSHHQSQAHRQENIWDNSNTYFIIKLLTFDFWLLSCFLGIMVNGNKPGTKNVGFGIQYYHLLV